MPDYLFMVFIVAEGYGGLEHRNSSALITARSDLPIVGQSSHSSSQDGKAEMTVEYARFLALCSHEYFHAWNIKRIKPAAFLNPDLQAENYTDLLWFFEGFTSYFDELMLIRSGVIDEKFYLEALTKTINQVGRNPGRHQQSLAESSFDAWVKYYRPDENAPNAIVSYYAKGSLVALALDLKIRAQTYGKRSLDDVMRALWQDFQTSGAAYRGLTQESLFATIEQASGLTLSSDLNAWVYGVEDIPLADLFQPFAIEWRTDEANAKASLNIQSRSAGAETVIVNVFKNGAAQRAGLSAGDILVACDGIRIGAAPDKIFARYRIGDTIQLHAFRRDELMTFELTLQAEQATPIELHLHDQPADAVRLRRRWMCNNYPDYSANAASVE